MIVLASILDKVFYIFTLVFPVVAIWKWKGKGVWIGALGAWASFICIGEILTLLDQGRQTPWSVLWDGLWIGFGWIFCLAYAGFIYLIYRIFKFLKSSRK